MHEPNARGPPASKTWYLKSQEYVRPAFNNWKQMAGFSEQRWANERHAFRLSKRDDYMEMRKQKGHIWRYCKICSESKAHTEPTAVAHQHFSTLMDRCCSKPDAFGMFKCNNCRDITHYAVTANRYPLLVTSSFLNAWRAPYQSGTDQYEGDLIHLDEICIPGGKIEDLHHAFKSEYAKFKRPVDVLLAAGLNNFKRDEPDVIMAKIRAFKATVFNRRDGSTFAVCTIPFAPHLVDLKPKSKNQFWNLGPKTRKMFVLNELIKAENRMPAEFSKIVNPKKCQNALIFAMIASGSSLLKLLRPAARSTSIGLLNFAYSDLKAWCRSSILPPGMQISSRWMRSPSYWSEPLWYGTLHAFRKLLVTSSGYLLACTA